VANNLVLYLLVSQPQYSMQAIRRLSVSMFPDSANERKSSKGSSSSQDTGIIDVSPGGDLEQHATYRNGSIYRGQLVDKRPEGFGTWEGATGSYEGQWLKGKQHGEGHERWNDGREYKGQFKLGMFDGHGCMTWTRDSGVQVYEGQYVKHLKHGRGKLIVADGRVFDGEWQRGKKHGHGTFTTAQGESRTCVWQDDYIQAQDDEVEVISVDCIKSQHKRSGGA